MGERTLRQLKWLSVLVPLAFVTLLEVLRVVVAPGLFASWPGYVLYSGIILIGALFFAEAIFSIVERLQDRLTQRNLELLALHEAGTAIVGELDLETVLQGVVDQARTLIDARYGALSYLRDGGEIGAFLTSGITPQERERIGPIPTGHGLLSVVLADGQTLRFTDLTQDPRSVGFPRHHPPMHSLLAVPLRSHGRILGNLYLTEKQDDAGFDIADEETLQRFATQATLAIANARLHQQVRALAITEERERIAREMHDSLAQVLGYVNTKAQATRQLVQDGRNERAAEQLGQMADAAQAAYADVRESILALRTSVQGDRSFFTTLHGYLEQWRDQSGVAVDLIPADPDDAVAARLTLSPLGEVQLLRIIQEALANVRKHAQATSVRIELRDHDDWVETIIDDNGIGFAPDNLGRTVFPRFGLATMRERAEASGGSLDIASAPGTGTHIVARLPHHYMGLR